MIDLIKAMLLWSKAHQIPVTMLVLAITVVPYFCSHVVRRGECKPHLWFMFMMNVIGIVAGVYVLVAAFDAAMTKPADQNTLWMWIGGMAVIFFTVNNN